MKFVIDPLNGVGPLRFGMTPAEVRELVGGKVESFKKTPDMSFPCDYFADAGVFAYYKAQGTLEAVEFAEPSDPVLCGEHLFGVSAQSLKGMFEELGPALETDSSGIISHSGGVGIYAPGWDDDSEQVVESVIVFEKGYYQ
jgi:hypothetical protein